MIPPYRRWTLWASAWVSSGSRPVSMLKISMSMSWRAIRSVMTIASGPNALARTAGDQSRSMVLRRASVSSRASR